MGVCGSTARWQSRSARAVAQVAGGSAERRPSSLPGSGFMCGTADPHAACEPPGRGAAGSAPAHASHPNDRAPCGAARAGTVHAGPCGPRPAASGRQRGGAPERHALCGHAAGCVFERQPAAMRGTQGAGEGLGTESGSGVPGAVGGGTQLLQHTQTGAQTCRAHTPAPPHLHRRGRGRGRLPPTLAPPPNLSPVGRAPCVTRAVAPACGGRRRLRRRL